MRARLLAPEALFGFGLTALGAFLLAGSADIVSPVPWGPGLMPRIVGVGLVVLGLATLVERARVPIPAAENGDDWFGFACVLAAVVVFGVLVEPVGFPVSAGAMFALVARGFGSRRTGRDVVIGFVLAAGVYVVFATLLGLQLSWGGLLESALEAR
jgi:putative tricarboxylic transport membrane protein